MNALNLTSLNFTDDAHASPYSSSLDDPMYKQYKPVVKELIPLPKPVLYLLMAAMVVVGVAYTIVGHLIKDLIIDIAECVLGPPNGEDKDKDNDLQRVTPLHPPINMALSYTNAFHLWDSDDMVIPFPPDVSPQASPLLLSTIPYIPSFFPTHSPSNNSSAALPGSPGPKEFCQNSGGPSPADYIHRAEIQYIQ